MIVAMAETATHPTTPTDPAAPSDPRPYSSETVGPPPPVGPHLSPPSRTPPPELPVRWLSAVVFVGFVFAVLVGRVAPASIGSATLPIVLGGALFCSGAVASRSGRLCLLTSAVFASMLALRTDPRLVTFNVVAALLFLLIAVVGPKRVFDWRPLQLLGDAVSLLLQPFVLISDRMAMEQNPDSIKPSRSARWQLAVGVAQGAVIAVPLLIVLAALLASADVVFSSWLSRSQIDVGQLWLAALRFSLGAGLALILLSRTVRDRSTVLSSGVALGRVPTLVVLVSVNAIFTVFVGAQIYALTSAGERILAEAGLTYSDYARQGFFQLLWVSGLTLIVLLSLRSAAERWFIGDRWFRWSSLATVALTIGVVVVALGRLQLYIADFGLTPLRFYSVVFSGWVAVAFAVVAARLLGWRPDRAWTFPALAVTGLIFLVGLNFANPEARIAEDLVERPSFGSAAHMLTGDGLAVLAEQFDRADPTSADDMRAELCENIPDSDHWLSWNLGRSRARAALLELC